MPATMGESTSAIWPGIQLTTMQTTGKQTSLVPATPVLFCCTTAPHWRDDGGLFHSLELVLTDIARETRGKRQLPWEDLPVPYGLGSN